MKKDLPASMENLSSSKTLFKNIKYGISINRSVLKDEKKIRTRHQKQLQNLLNEKNKEINIQTNPDSAVTDFSSHSLTKEEHSILQFGLKHGVATRPNQSSILAYAENI